MLLCGRYDKKKRPFDRELFVRLSFERTHKRYWLVWDAVSVGGLLGSSQRALVR